MVILFAEGLSENNWDLRPMRKGLARLALKAWNSHTPANELEVIPIGLTYEHYQGEGKIMLINIGKGIKANEFDIQGNEAQFVREFNQRVFNGLASLLPVYPQLKPNSETHQQFRFQLKQEAAKTDDISKILSSIQLQENQTKPAVKEYKIIQNTLLFLPLYAFAKWLAQKLFKQALFHDSVIFGLLLFLWPVYLLLVFGLIRLFI